MSTSPLDAIQAVYTAKQIVTLAENRAGNPGKNLGTTGVESLTAPAYLELQMILDHLGATRTIPFERVALDITCGSQINALPTNFWRVGFADPAYLIDPDSGARSRLRLLDAEQFHNRLTDNLQAGTPFVAFINRNTGTLTFDLAPDRAYTVELHYYPWEAPLAAITDKPWFPYSAYLVEDLLCKLYLAGDDTRWQVSDRERARLMSEINGSFGDARDRASMKVDLDPAIYRPPLIFD